MGVALALVALYALLFLALFFYLANAKGDE